MWSTKTKLSQTSKMTFQNHFASLVFFAAWAQAEANSWVFSSNSETPSSCRARVCVSCIGSINVAVGFVGFKANIQSPLKSCGYFQGLLRNLQIRHVEGEEETSDPRLWILKMLDEKQTKKRRLGACGPNGIPLANVKNQARLRCTWPIAQTFAWSRLVPNLDHTPDEESAVFDLMCGSFWHARTPGTIDEALSIGSMQSGLQLEVGPRT